MALILLVGTEQGRSGFDQAMVSVGLDPLPWERYYGGFETLVAGTAPVFWIFFLLTGLSVFMLRFKNPGLQRPYSIPFYPLPPIIFCLTCVYMLWASMDYAKELSLLGWVPLAAGVPLYLLSGRRPKGV